MNCNMNIREAKIDDFDAIWPIFHEIVKAGETYAYPVDTSKEGAIKLWLDSPRKTFIFVDDGKILGLISSKRIRLALEITFVIVVVWFLQQREGMGLLLQCVSTL